MSEIAETSQANTGSGDSSLSSRSFMSPNFVRDRPIKNVARHKGSQIFFTTKCWHF